MTTTIGEFPHYFLKITTSLFGWPSNVFGRR
jgi:hypothetical protein